MQGKEVRGVPRSISPEPWLDPVSTSVVRYCVGEIGEIGVSPFKNNMESESREAGKVRDGLVPRLSYILL